MSNKLNLGYISLLLFVLSSYAYAGTTMELSCGLHKTPNSVFIHAQKLLRENNIDHFFSCIAEEDQNDFVEQALTGLVIVATLSEDISDQLIPILKKYKFNLDDDGGDIAAGIKKVKNIKPFFLELYSVLSLIAEKQGTVLGNERSELIDVVIEESTASAIEKFYQVTGKEKNNKVFFKRVSGSWYLAVSDNALANKNQ